MQLSIYYLRRFGDDLTPNGVLVGASGLEPPTSRLSGVCSNQLSYAPDLIFALYLV